MRILVSNVYSWDNKGDAAIVLCMLDDIRRQFPKAQIVLSVMDPDTGHHFGGGEVVPNFLTLLKRTYGGHATSLWGRIRYALACQGVALRLRLFQALMRCGARPFWLFHGEVADRIRVFEACDLVIACGGGYLLAPHKRRKLERVLGYDDLTFLAKDFALASLFGRPYLLYHQSIGPFAQTHQAMSILPALAGAKAIICREAITFTRLKALGLNNLVKGADIAFRLTSVPGDGLIRYGFDKKRTNVGVTVRECLDSAAQAGYESEFASFLSDLLGATPEWDVFILPQVIFEAGGDNDLRAADRIYALIPVPLRSRVHVVRENLHPGELKHMISRMRYFIGTRMHSNIFALSSGVKTLAISYEPKTDGIMQMLGLPEYVMAAAGLTSKELTEKFRRLSGDGDYVGKLAASLKSIEALNSVDLVRLAGL